MTQVAWMLDREAETLQSMVQHCNYFPDQMRLSGIFTPFFENAEFIEKQIRIISGMYNPNEIPIINDGPDPWINHVRGQSFVEGVEVDPTNPSAANARSDFDFWYREQSVVNGDKFFIGGNEELGLFHIPHPRPFPSKLRQEYSEWILPKLKRVGAELIAMANFKVVLDQVVTREYDQRIVNAHNSVLPLFDGLASERRIIEAQDQDSCGYTIHVAWAQLDKGSTVAQQKLPLEAMSGTTLRNNMAGAQAVWYPSVLGLWAEYLRGNLDIQLLSGEAAFESEGRSAPIGEHSAYSRVLFEHHGGFTTAENILGIPEYADFGPDDTLRTYTFTQYGELSNLNKRFSELVETHPGTHSFRRLSLNSQMKLPDRVETAMDEVSVRTRDPSISQFFDKYGIQPNTSVVNYNVNARRAPRPGLTSHDLITPS